MIVHVQQQVQMGKWMYIITRILYPLYLINKDDIWHLHVRWPHLTEFFILFFPEILVPSIQVLLLLSEVFLLKNKIEYVWIGQSNFFSNKMHAPTIQSIQRVIPQIYQIILKVLIIKTFNKTSLGEWTFHSLSALPLPPIEALWIFSP